MFGGGRKSEVCSVVIFGGQVVEKLHVELSSYLGEKFKMRSF